MGDKIIIESEKELRKWFEKNFTKFGYSEIFKNNKSKFPDFIMKREGNIVRVELETVSSHFLLHKHNPSLVDEIICIENDLEVGVKTIRIEELKYLPRLVRISATVDEETVKAIEKLLKNKKFRNKSHIIESAIESLMKAEVKNGN